MSLKIGLLLPQSGEYPSMPFDLVDGLRLSLQELGKTDIQIVTESIGFGENHQQNISKAERLVLAEDVQLLIAYATSLNAEAFYNFAETCNKPMLFLDAGMEVFETRPSAKCRHLTLQGMHASRIVGRLAGENGAEVISSTSFYDGGYRGPWSIVRGIEEAGGSVCGNYVSLHTPSDFTIQPYLDLLKNSGGKTVTASFSTYLAELFMKELKSAGTEAVQLPFYCSPFMAEEQLLSKIDFPGGEFHTIVPWASSLDNKAQLTMSTSVKKNKNKTANLFHLLGWEAGIAAEKILKDGIESTADWSFESPRGKVTFHPDSTCSYAPLYRGKIKAGENGKCRLEISETIDVDGAAHYELFLDKPQGQISRWKNNYWCI